MNEFKQLVKDIKSKPKKTRITITIDEELNELLKKQKEFNISHLCNQFLWHYLKKEVRRHN
jgi:hypothetical protein